ncbi:MAG: 3-isopropylmalate dehydratase small subunit [Acidimicrobiales bacterium]
MEPLRVVRSVAVPVLMANVDTDVITPMRRIVGRSEHPLHHYAFEALRYLDGDGDTGRPDPAFPLNDPRYAGASIMLTGPNFGCGSSRETAPAAIAALGFRVLIGPSFGDIFFNNCFQQGVLPITLDEAVVAGLTGELTVEVETQTVTAGSTTVISFELNPLRKACLLEGTDMIGMSLGYADRIGAWQDRDRVARPWAWETLA